MSDLENKIKATQAIVEATSFEKMCLWREYHQNRKYSWTSDNSGYLPTVGSIRIGRKVKVWPVCISVTWAEIAGFNTMFWHPTSMVVDHSLIEKWFDDNFPHIPKIDRKDAGNFHNVFRGIE